jgi:hypothetical protein
VPDDRVPFAWELSGGVRALLDLGDEPAAVAGPGGVEVLTGVEAAPGVPRALAPGVGEVWAPGP